MNGQKITPKGRVLRLAKLVLINLAVILGFVVIIELALGSWLYGPEFGTLNVGLNSNRVETDSPYYPEGTPVYYRRDSNGLRGDHETPEDITILTVGGSTTNDRVVSEGDTWPDVLEEQLQAAGYDHVVANAGIDGHSSLGHIRSFELWFPNIPGLAPDYALIYVGHNDRGVASGEVPQPDSMTSPSWSRRFGVYIRNHSVFSRAIKNLSGWIAASQIDVTYGEFDTSEDNVRFVPVELPALDMERLAPLLAAYGERLEVLNTMVLQFGTIPVFITQPVGLLREGATGPEEVEGSRAGLIERELNLYNQVLLEFCTEKDALCIDLASEVSFDTADFYDAIHTTPSGSRRIGEYLAAKWPQVVAAP